MTLTKLIEASNNYAELNSRLIRAETELQVLSVMKDNLIPVNEKAVNGIKRKCYYAKIEYLKLLHIAKLEKEGKTFQPAGKEATDGNWQVYRLTEEGSYQHLATMRSEKDAIARLRQLARCESTKAILTKVDGDLYTVKVDFETEVNLTNQTTAFIIEGSKEQAATFIASI